MTEKKWSFKEHKGQIITGIVIAICLSVGGWIWRNAASVPEKLVVKSGIRETLERYANDINNNSFDATKYFAGSVPVFFEDKDQTPRLINNFWENRFAKVFSEYHARFDYETLTVTCGEDSHCASIILYSDYFNKNEEKQYTNQKSRYDMKFDQEYRIVEIIQVVYKDPSE